MRTLAWPSASNPQSLKLCGRQPLKRFERVVQAAVNSGQPFKKKKSHLPAPTESFSFWSEKLTSDGVRRGLFFSLAWAPTHSKSVHPTEAGSSTTRSKAGQPTPLIFRLEQYSQIKCLHDQQDNTTDRPPLARTMSPHLRPVMSFVSPFFAFQLCFPSMI